MTNHHEIVITWPDKNTGTDPMAYDFSNGNRSGKREGGMESRNEATGLYWEETLQLILNPIKQIHSRRQGIGKIFRSGNHIRLMPCLLNFMTTHKHTNLFVATTNSLKLFSSSRERTPVCTLSNSRDTPYPFRYISIVRLFNRRLFPLWHENKGKQS